MKRSLYAFLFLGTLIDNLKADVVAVEGCIVDSSKMVSGLIGDVYYLPWADDNYGTFTSGIPPLVNGLYASNPNIITASDDHSLTECATVAANVRSTLLNFSSQEYGFNEEVWAENPNLLDEDGSPVSIPVTNYVMSLNGYLIPPVSGVYRFVIENVDTLLLLSIGNGLAPFGCYEKPDQTQVFNKIIAEAEVGIDESQQVEVVMAAGYAYPITIFYMNYEGTSSYGLSYYEPLSGDLKSDWTGFAFSSYDLSGENIRFSEHQNFFGNVPSTTFITSTSTALIRATVTDEESLNVFTEYVVSEKLVIAEIDPFVLETSTHFIAYTGSTTTTLVTLTSTVSSSILQEQIYVGVPLLTFTTTVTSYYTDSESINGYTSLATAFPNTTTPFVSKIVIEDVPYGHTANTNFLPGPVSTITTYDTEYVTHSSNQENPPTIETVYYVYTPYSTYSTVTSSFSNVITEVTTFTTNSSSGGISALSTSTSSGIIASPSLTTFAISTISYGSESTCQTNVPLFSNTTMNLSSASSSSLSCIASSATNSVSVNTAVYNFVIDVSSSETFYVIADFPEVQNPPEPSLSFNNYDICEGTLEQIDYTVEENNSSVIRLWEKIELTSSDVLQNYTLLATLIAPVNASSVENSQVVTIVVPVIYGTFSKRDGVVNGYVAYTYSLSGSLPTVLKITQIDNKQAASMFGIYSNALTSSISSTYSKTLDSLSKTNAASSTLELYSSSLNSTSSTLALSSSILYSASSNLSFTSSVLTGFTTAAASQSSESASDGFLSSTPLASLSSITDSASSISLTSSTVQNQETTESNESVTVITITSCGTKSCYPVVFTTSNAKQSSGILSTKVVPTASVSASDSFFAKLSTSSLTSSNYISSAENKGVELNKLVSAKNILAVVLLFFM